LLIAVFSLAALAEEHPGKPVERPAHSEQGVPYPNVTGQNGPGVLSLLPPDSVTEHAIDTPAGKLAYTATAGTFSLFDQSGERSAAIFYTAFVKTSDKTNDPARPVTFVFNGGRSRDD
jgi:carboxypeptidase C (cathepsin A)